MGTQKDELDALDQRLSQLQERKRMSPDRPMRRSLSAPTSLMHDSEEIRAANKRVEELVKQAGAPRMLKLDSLRPSPFQTKTVTEETVADLVENLRNNPLTTPIVVREIESGVYEIIAGHGRTLCFSILGRLEIPGVVVQMTDEEAEGAVFYDNFYPPDICDFQKFLGLKQIKNRRNLTHEQLADRSGISRQLVGYLMSFDRLPAEALDLVRADPKILGAAVAMKLTQLDSSLAKRVVEGLQLVQAGKLKQAGLLDWVIQTPKARLSEPTVVKAGRRVFAKFTRRDSRLTIDFSDMKNAESLEKEILAMVKARASSTS
jgi:ParB family chromosome partitioning protein